VLTTRVGHQQVPYVKDVMISIMIITCTISGAPREASQQSQPMGDQPCCGWTRTAVAYNTPTLCNAWHCMHTRVGATQMLLLASLRLPDRLPAVLAHCCGVLHRPHQLQRAFESNWLKLCKDVQHLTYTT
jgi:hypothetical protein